MLRQAVAICSTMEFGKAHGGIWSLGADASAAYDSRRPIFWPLWYIERRSFLCATAGWEPDGGNA